MANDAAGTSEECISCGACCKYLILQVNPACMNSSNRYWIELHGIRLVRRGQAVLAYIPTPCSALQADNTCGIYEKRPEPCRAWPSSQSDIDDLHDYIGEEVCTVTIKRNSSTQEG